MTVSYRTGITILQFVFFVPSFFISLFLCIRQGLKGAATWRFIVTFSALRISGDVSYFITLSHPSVDAYISVVVCELMGLAPLMLTCVALVQNVNRVTNTIPGWAFYIIPLLSVVGLILGIVGANSAISSGIKTGSIAINGLLESTLALFLACFALLLIGFTAVVVDTYRHLEKRRSLDIKYRILVIVALAIPFAFVRILYAALGDYTDNITFNVLYGSDTAYLCMDVLMEIICISIFLTSAFLVPPPKKSVPIDV